MSEVPLGPSDAETRWIGVRAHRALLVVAGLVALGESLAVPAHLAVALVGVALALGAVPVGRDLSAAEALAVAVAYALRPRLFTVGVLELGDEALVWSSGSVAVRAAERVHRGRLDLAGRDVDDARALAAAVDAASAAGESRVSLTVLAAGERPTVLGSTAALSPPEGWRPGPGLASVAAGLGPSTELALLERPGHVRSAHGVRRVYRVRDFSAVAPGAALLERILREDGVADVVVRLEVVAADRAGRLAARAAHRVGSDDAAGRALGFRRSARAQRHMARLAQREREVAGGAALVRCAVYLVVAADDLDALLERAGTLWRRAHEAGLRLDAGWGRQADWLKAALPGGGPPGRRGPTRPWTHWATSRDLVALRLPAHDAGTGLAGEPVGRAIFGGPFRLDPIDAYRAGLVTNPNVVVAGAIGAGKSTVVKMQVARALRRGRRVVVVDPKGEYGDLARAHGAEPVVLGRDGWCDPVGGDDGRDLVRALLAGAQGAPLTDDQHFVLDSLWSRLGANRPPRVLRALLGGLDGALEDERPSARRSLALVLHRLVDGDLAGLFDGDGAPLALGGPLVVVDLSAQWSSAALPLATLCVVAAAQRIVGDGATTGYLVLDEAWALLGEPAALRWLRGSWKLARARGLSHVLVLHRWGDVRATGDEGSAQLEQARGLLRECETSWLFRQPPDEAHEMRAALDLSELEARYLTSLPRGVALVRYGPHRSVVRVEPDARDAALVATDAAMSRGA